MKLMVWLMPDIATPGRRPAYHHRSGTLARTSFDVVVDPELAGWSYTGLRVITLAPDVPFAWSTGTREVAVLPLRGSCRVDWPDGSVELAGRESVFSAVSDFLYVPRDTEIVVLSRGGAQIAVPSAESTRRLEVAYCPADAVSVERRVGAVDASDQQLPEPGGAGDGGQARRRGGAHAGRQLVLIPTAQARRVA
jgi:5-deoxy-glucuronate isomerase